MKSLSPIAFVDAPDESRRRTSRSRVVRLLAGSASSEDPETADAFWCSRLDGFCAEQHRGRRNRCHNGETFGIPASRFAFSPQHYS